MDDLAIRFGIVGGMDEVGRGCLAGPVCVGLVVAGNLEPPNGLTDSKRLTEKQREALYEPLLEWAEVATVGWAQASEVDSAGIMGALRVAGQRAVAAASRSMGGRALGAILLDGSHDWLSETGTLWDQELAIDPASRTPWALPPVVTRVKADLTVPAVSAASVIAKVERDRHMRALTDPGYDWASNKGYGSAAHRAAIRRLGPSAEHRKTWNLLGDQRD